MKPMTDEPVVNPDHLDALVSAALAVHGSRLDEAQRALLRQHAERLRTLAAQLDGYRLTNADEPDASFQPIDRVDAV
jgi:hypothetical protein